MTMKEKGEHEEMVEVAKDLLKSGVGLTEVEQCTKLSEEQIKKYNSEIKEK